ncbi:F0F1 ATP synthase subunit B family protein [Sphingomonas nostoxanthinifaciens]|uniref:F0F1 ATP synthase subunit B family protein n=1 Tax=Sphingomonas nostoxanthinifaciens TaxID=2872652 RepID=UPI001CC213CE|nr:ATPase [Sphingomonas nostoxanthinifaciens]UAK23528.1 ATPase [Sphingomonas nostoxanthinifaciens]
MPQIDQIATIYASQLFWLVVVFALIYFGIGRAMLPRIEKTIADRDARISGDLAAAKQARAAADEADVTYQTKLSEARATAHAAALAAKAHAGTVIELRLKSADVDIAQRIAHAERALRAAEVEAISHIEAVAIDAAQDIVTRVAGLSADRARVAAAVADAMAQG